MVVLDALLDHVRRFALKLLVDLEVPPRFLRSAACQLGSLEGGTYEKATIMVNSLMMHTLVNSLIAAAWLSTSHWMSMIRNEKDRPSFSIRPWMYSGCSRWYRRLAPNQQRSSQCEEFNGPQIKHPRRRSDLVVRLNVPKLPCDAPNVRNDRVSLLTQVDLDRIERADALVGTRGAAHDHTRAAYSGAGRGRDHGRRCWGWTGAGA